MRIDVEPGKYVVAVSGGVDSVVLLNVLSMLPEVEIIVAHFDHGIRENSDEDRKFVESLAEKYNLPFEYNREELGPDASEALARERRYEFLGEVCEKYEAKAIITAHHKDDLLETAIINLLRGTGRKGLNSLKSGTIIRPLLDITKEKIKDYALKNKLKWREDTTNKDEKYLRNKVRSKLGSSSNEDKRKLEKLIADNKLRNEILENLISELNVDLQSNSLPRRWFVNLPHDVAGEILANWLRNNMTEFDRKNIGRLVVAMKAGKINNRYDADKTHVILIEKEQISLQVRSL